MTGCVSIHDVNPRAVRTGTAPGNALTPEEIKLHLRIDADDATQDVPLLAYAAAAEEAARKMADRTCLSGSWIQYMDEFPSEIRLMNSPVTAITNVKYYDTAGTLQTLSSSAYLSDLNQEPAVIVPATGYSWPAVQSDRPGAAYVTYTAGYADASSIPADMKLGMIHLVAHWYENREPVVVGSTPTNLPWVAEQLIRGCWTGFMW